MWLSTSPNSVTYVVKAVNLVADSKQVRELSNVDKRCQKRQSVGFYAQNYVFLLVKKLSQRSSKYSEFSYVSPTCDSSIISSDANLKNNETSYNEEVISENTEFTDYFDM